MSWAFKFIEEIVFPSICIGCDTEGVMLCSNCEVSLVSPKDSKEVLSAVHYKDPIANQIIKEFKYQGIKAWAKTCAKIIHTRLSHHLKGDVVTFIPLHPTKFRKRGFNQTELIAEELSLILEIPSLPLLDKVKATKDQAGLTAKERSVNLLGAFEYSTLDSFETVILIDDVCTTGNTLRECERVLLKNGSKKVIKVSFAIEN